MRNPTAMALAGLVLASVIAAFLSYWGNVPRHGKCLTWHFEPTQVIARGDATLPAMKWVCDRWSDDQNSN